MRLIDADVLYETLCHVWDRSDSEEFEQAVFKVIANAPTADRPTGEWIKSDILPNGWHCSHCDAPVMTDDIDEMLFCPHCGSYNGGEEE